MLWPGPTVPHLHADLGSPSLPGLGGAARHLLKRQQVGRTPQLLRSLALAAAGWEETAAFNGCYALGGWGSNYACTAQQPHGTGEAFSTPSTNPLMPAPPEGAEGAGEGADIGVVDVAVDHVGGCSRQGRQGWQRL